MNLNMNLTALVFILIMITIHYIADFIFQDEEWALGKSSSNTDLLMHTTTYTAIWIICAGALIMITGEHLVPKLLWFFPITFVVHTITDYFTSRWIKKKFDAKYYGSPIPNFGAFSSIGFDQVLHYIQIFGTYYLLNK